MGQKAYRFLPIVRFRLGVNTFKYKLIILYIQSPSTTLSTGVNPLPMSITEGGRTRVDLTDYGEIFKLFQIIGVYQINSQLFINASIFPGEDL
jgi:hypothetical protein